MLQGVWIFILFIIFNPEAKKFTTGIFRRSASNTESKITKQEEFALSEVETEKLYKSQ